MRMALGLHSSSGKGNERCKEMVAMGGEGEKGNNYGVQNS